MEIDFSNPDKSGYVQVYTGNSKGKTTASLGLALRALGHGWKVLLAQFMKAENMWSYGEIKTLSKLSSQVTVHQYGLSMVGKITEQDKTCLKKGWEDCKQAISENKYDLIILDEINHLTQQGIIPVGEVLDVIHSKPKALELVLTGRYADPSIIEAADLVTEMTCVKHYFQKGVMAREGIEW